MNARDLIERYNDAWNRQDLDAVCALHAPGMVFENHTAGERAEGGAVRHHTGAISAASTQPIFAAEPVVTTTNHGRATNVIAEPVSEMSSAVTSPSSERSRQIMASIIKRLYGLCQE